VGNVQVTTASPLRTGSR